MKFTKSQLELFLPLLLIVLYSLSLIIPLFSPIYFGLVSLAGIYYFPVRFLICLKGKNSKEIMISFFTNAFFALATGMAGVYPFMYEIPFFKMLVIAHIVLAIVATILLYRKNGVNNNVLISFLLFVLLTCVLIFANKEPFVNDADSIYNIEEIDYFKYD